MTGLSIISLAPAAAANVELAHGNAIIGWLADGTPWRAAPSRPASAERGRATPPVLPSPLLCELAYAVAELARQGRTRAVVRVGAAHEPWELGLESAGPDLHLTLFQGGTLPEVAIHERRADARVVAARVLAAIDAALADSAGRLRDAPVDLGERGERDEREVDDGFELRAPDAAPRSSADAPLAAARLELATSLSFAVDAEVPEWSSVSVDPTGEVSVLFAADVLLRTPSAHVLPSGSALRADLLSLLFKGRLRFAVGDHTRELVDVFVFLVAEQLVTLAEGALDAWARGRAYHRRVEAGGAICGVRVNPAGAAALTLGTARRGGDERAETWTFPAVEVGALSQGVVAFGRALARSLTRRDRAQAYNLRLTAFRARVREIAERLREATRDDSKVNAAPESYRAFAAVERPARPSTDAFGHARLRFTPKWLATVPSIDLRATFLCGDALVVGATRESCCFDRRTGEILWRRPLPRAVLVVTPVGLGRLEADGTLSMHDLASGDVSWQTRLAPRVGSSASGAVVHAPGLPRMLVVSEGARHLCAVDLHGGEIRWRHAARRGGAFRLRRAGKLLVVASGEPALTALDVLTGEVVWRFCDRLRFASHVAVDQDALFAIAGGGGFVGRSGARLHHLDPWSGAPRWSCDLPLNVVPVGAPLLAQETVLVVTHGRRGTGIVGFDRRTGALLFDRIACSSAASCMVVDDLCVVNSEGGELVGIDATTGGIRYRHVFGGGTDGDRPRRLEPVLRSGALFVPQSEVHVVRPRDGTILGKVPSDLIPDLLRVDERCDVYVVEESGHLAAFGAAPRLSLVQG